MTKFSLKDAGAEGGKGAGSSRCITKRPRSSSRATPRRSSKLWEDDGTEPVVEEHEEDNEENSEEEGEEEDEMEQGGESHAIGPNSGTLADLDVLDCPVCFESLTVPVFQCDNGHIVCSSCCTKVENKCPSCCLPIGYMRCRAIENIIKSVKISCENRQYGCKEKVSYGEKDDHAEKCLFAPCPCPIPLCSFTGPIKQILSHLLRTHSIKSKKFQYCSLFLVSLAKNEEFLVFQEETEGSLFIVKNTIERIGNAVTVSYVERIGPRKRNFTFSIFAKNDGNSLRIQYAMESGLDQVKRPTGFLIVPNDFFSSRQLKLSLCIQNY